MIAGTRATADSLAHLGAGQAGPHGPEEEFVIVERIHGITGGRLTSGQIEGIGGRVKKKLVRTIYSMR
jgi:hypothetical protein